MEQTMVCTLCPRQCGAIRTQGHGTGYCKQGTLPRVARASLHHWEEPCISGTKGSGTVFFVGCTLGCVFCQNAEITQNSQPIGKPLPPEELAKVFLSLQEQGAHNINLVNPTHFVPAIAKALRLANLSIPVVYNSSGYESVETLKSLEGLVDIYLPDFKYWQEETAYAYAGAKDYPTVAKVALAEMVRQCGAPKCDENGLLTCGVMVRHLILPKHTKESIAILQWLAEQFGKEILVSLMAQYLPCGKVSDTKYQELNRPITQRELDKVTDVLQQLPLDGYVQERSSAKAQYIPPFAPDCQ